MPIEMQVLLNIDLIIHNHIQVSMVLILNIIMCDCVLFDDCLKPILALNCRLQVTDSKSTLRAGPLALA